VQRDLEAQQQRVGTRLPGLDLLLESLLVHEHRGAASREKGKCKGRVGMQADVRVHLLADKNFCTFFSDSLVTYKINSFLS
jgi:hypothetical protein